MIFTAFEVYIKLVKRSSHKFQFQRLAYLLSELTVKIEDSGDSELGQYLAFIIPRILFVLNSTFGAVYSRNTEFAIWCAKRASREVG